MQGGQPQPDVLKRMDRDHVWHPLTQHQRYREGAAPLIITGGKGATVSDINGQTYLDGTAGLWCVNVGYGRKELVDAASRQMSELAYYPMTQSHPKAIQLSEKLAEYLPWTPRIYLSNSGSEANEAAFKAIRQYWRIKGRWRKTKILSRHRGYHGTTLGALSATGQNERKRDYEPLVPGFIQVSAPYCYRCPFHLSYPSCQLQCAEDFQRRLEIEDPETVAAIVVEPVIAGGGIIVPPDDYLQKVAQIASDNDVKLIVDEVVTGFGRTGSMFAHTTFGVKPDAVTMAKGLASGYMPVGATAFSEEIFEAFMGAADSGRHFRHVNTYGGHPVAAAVALANIEVIERESLAERSKEVGEILHDAFVKMISHIPFIGDVRSRGLLVGVELVEDREKKTPKNNLFMRQVIQNALQEGVIIGKVTDVTAYSNNTIMLAPPLVITPKEAHNLANAIFSAIQNATQRTKVS